MVAFVPRLRPLFITCSMEVGDTWEGGCADEVLLGRAWASLGELHTSVVYRTTCIDQPIDRQCLSHSRDTDTLHVPTLPCGAAMPRSCEQCSA